MGRLAHLATTVHEAQQWSCLVHKVRSPPKKACTIICSASRAHKASPVLRKEAPKEKKPSAQQVTSARPEPSSRVSTPALEGLSVKGQTSPPRQIVPNVPR